MTARSLVIVALVLCTVLGFGLGWTAWKFHEQEDSVCQILTELRDSAQRMPSPAFDARLETALGNHHC